MANEEDAKTDYEKARNELVAALAKKKAIDRNLVSPLTSPQ